MDISAHVFIIYTLKMMTIYSTL